MTAEMDRVHKGYRYTTGAFQDPEDGCTGVSLHREYEQLDHIIRSKKDDRPVGRVIHYHGLNELTVEIEVEVPFDIAKEFIEEAEAQLKVG